MSKFSHLPTAHNYPPVKAYDYVTAELKAISLL